ncbi:MAG: NAD(P)-dependent oxidoreductase, partial [Pseudomonadota bacterium]|nr:NAD(P)-dependent oxidoreductase [Pseudomonadota bacterium]
MKIRFENSMPLAADYLNAFGSAEGFESGTLTPEDLVDVDVLAVRSTTKVNADLLNCANRLALVATATAGYNHIDTQYLQQQGIYWTSAAGCNAQAVAEYVLSVLANAHLSNKLDLHTATVGIVGAGHVGTALSGLLDALSVRYKLYDPPLQEAGDTRTFADWQSIIACDVITLHVPLIT